MKYENLESANKLSKEIKELKNAQEILDDTTQPLTPVIKFKGYNFEYLLPTDISNQVYFLIVEFIDNEINNKNEELEKL